MRLMSCLFSLLMLPALACAADFVEHPVTLEVAGGTLMGTEMLPDGGGKTPVVLLHAGSGPTDRDGNSALLPGHNDSLRMVAEALARQGVATVRYDKRGIAASAAAGLKEADLRLDTYIDDAAAWLRKLRADPRFSRVIMAGHSEGALIAAAACARGGADACVSISGAGRPLDDILRAQLKPQLPPVLAEQNERILQALKQGKLADEVPPQLMALYRPSVQPYLISSFKVDPRTAVAALRMPLLILQGSTDIQVSVADARELAAAAQAARLVIVEGMNHVLKMVPDDRVAQLNSYSDPALPVSPQLLTALTDFVKAR